MTWLKKWVDAEMAKLPVQERDQVQEALKTWSGTLREIWKQWRRGR